MHMQNWGGIHKQVAAGIVYHRVIIGGICRTGVVPVPGINKQGAAEIVYHQVIIGGICRTGVVQYLYTGGSWAPLSPGYHRWHRQNWGGIYTQEAAGLLYNQVVMGSIGRTVVVFINRGQQSWSITRGIGNTSGRTVVVFINKGQLDSSITR